MKTISIQILTNRINTDLSSLMTYAYQYNIKHGITLHFDVKPVDVSGYVSAQVKNMSGNYVWALTGAEKLVPIDLAHDITVFMFDQNEWKTPWWNPFPLALNTPTSSCYLVGNIPFINLGYYTPHAADTNLMFIHELMHAYTKMAGVADQMDTYYKNDQPDAPDGNFAIQWNRLSSWLGPQTPMNDTPTVILTRNTDNGVETLGTLTVTQPHGSIWSCRTLERPWKDNMTNVSCIPKGSYPCSIQPFHSTSMYELSNTGPRIGIFIHSANYFNQLEGCIALGVNPSDINADHQIDVTSSVATITEFMNLLGDKPFTLLIQ